MHQDPLDHSTPVPAQDAASCSRPAASSLRAEVEIDGWDEQFAGRIRAGGRVVTFRGWLSFIGCIDGLQRSRDGPRAPPAPPAGAPRAESGRFGLPSGTADAAVRTDHSTTTPGGDPPRQTPREA